MAQPTHMTPSKAETFLREAPQKRVRAERPAAGECLGLHLQLLKGARQKAGKSMQAASGWRPKPV